VSIDEFAQKLRPRGSKNDFFQKVDDVPPYAKIQKSKKHGFSPITFDRKVFASKDYHIRVQLDERIQKTYSLSTNKEVHFCRLLEKGQKCRVPITLHVEKRMRRCDFR
jgi:hypothetical protein